MSVFASLFNFLGDEKIKFQWLNRALLKVKTNSDETEVTFVTENEHITADSFYHNELKKVGIVVWIDLEDFEAWKQEKNKNG